ncbi:hypothetical protein ACIP5Y_21585 [Nocardia sp. NPDC088792]|uniref:hypothetical protein n=1 Tax=Nocardia sp. NPDC088792 TaxID=3364332 RepID=UPI00381B0FAA
MALLHVFRWLRAEHEHTRPFGNDRFARDTLENLVSIFDTMKTDIETLLAKLGPLVDKLGPALAQFTAGGTADDLLLTLEALLPPDVKDELVKLHTFVEQIAQFVDNVTPAQSAPAPEGSMHAEVEVGPTE